MARLDIGSFEMRGRGVGPGGVRVPKTAEVVADHIRKRIVRGELVEGDFLPPEGQLMATLNISRPTLREAFRILEAESLISVVRGSRTGARVQTPSIEPVSRYAGFVLQSQGITAADIYEARLAIEPFIARRLAERRDPADAARLREESDALRKLVEDGRYIDFLIGLVEFHRVLVELGGNKTLLFLTTVLQEMTARHQVEFIQRRSMPEDLQAKRARWGLRSFERLVQLIEAGDAAGAEDHWRLHVLNSNQSWVPPEEANKPIDLFD